MRVAAREAAAQNVALRLDSLYAAISPMFESPIERLMWWLLQERLFSLNSVKTHCATIEDVGKPFAPHFGHVTIVPQARVENYRVDFAVQVGMWAGDAPLWIAIECDGHDFHERTKEQVARDRERDRIMISLGWPVFHFTGSEIFRAAPNLLDPLNKYVKKALRS